ncbi:hypothetical protein G7054_g8916 [Neopestalotiopsis clavispora]|nr:hypothetical protein G7054_g8916 [Neopestalotiopsis clavispora]
MAITLASIFRLVAGLMVLSPVAMLCLSATINSHRMSRPRRLDQHHRALSHGLLSHDHYHHAPWHLSSLWHLRHPYVYFHRVGNVYEHEYQGHPYHGDAYQRLSPPALIELPRLSGQESGETMEAGMVTCH